MNKIFVSLLTFILVFSAVSSNILAASNKDREHIFENVENTKYSLKNENGSTIVTSEYVNKESNQVHKFVIIENENFRLVEHFIDSALSSQTKLIKKIRKANNKGPWWKTRNKASFRFC